MRCWGRVFFVGMLLCVLTGCGGGATSGTALPVSDPSLASTSTSAAQAASPGAALGGKVVVRTMLAVPPDQRASILANRATIEAQDHKVSGDGSFVYWPDLDASGWIVTYGGQTVATSPDGTFEITRGADAGGTIAHPSDATLKIAFTAGQLAPVGSAPALIVVPVVFGGPVQMNMSDANKQATGKTRKLANVTRIDPNPLRTGPLGTYSTQAIAECEITDGPADVAPGYFALVNYFGSTCDKRVRAGACPNENRLSDVEQFINAGVVILPLVAFQSLFSPSSRPLPGVGNPIVSRVQCYVNHKGRECQGLIPGDVAVQTPLGIVKAGGKATVSVQRGGIVPLTIHNNGAFGYTVVKRTPASTLRGLLGGPGYEDGGPRISHFNAALLDAYVRSGAGGINKDIYQTDRTLQYVVPYSAEAGQTETYLLSVDDATVELTFQVTPDTSPTPSPTPTASPTPTPSASPSPTASPTPSPSPTATPNLPLAITPAAPAVKPGDAIAFSASGGSGAGYAWTLPTNNSGGTIDVNTGAYVAGPTGGVVDVVSVTDSEGTSTSANVSVEQETGTFTEFALQTAQGGPFFIVSTSGKLYFTHSATGFNLGSIAVDGTVNMFGTSLTYNGGGQMTVGPDGNLWTSGSSTNSPSHVSIGRYTPAGVFTEFFIPSPAAPYDWKVVTGLTSGADGKVYFGEFTPTNNWAGNLVGGEIGYVGSIGTDGTFGPEVQIGPPSLLNGSNAHAANGLTLGPDGMIWFVDYFGVAICQIAANGTVNSFPIPTANCQPTQITVGADGNLWFVERAASKIGAISINGAFREFATPTPNAQPYQITPGPDGNLWFTEYNANKIGRITTAGVITEYDIPTASSGAACIVTGPDGNLWFTEAVTNKIGRVTP